MVELNGLLLNFNWARKYVWPIIHQFTYHCEINSNVKILFYELIPKYFIVCGICSSNFIKKIKSVPFPETKRKLQILLIDIHNEINELNEKPAMSYEQADKLYQYQNKNLIWYVILGLIYHKDRNFEQFFKIGLPLFDLNYNTIPKTNEEIINLYNKKFNRCLTLNYINDLYIFGKKKDLILRYDHSTKIIISIIVICILLFLILNIFYKPGHSIK